jgi:hypothetical protein
MFGTLTVVGRLRILVSSGLRLVGVVPAPLVRMWGCVSDGKTWHRPPYYGDQEQTILVGLTSIITRNPPMPPKFNRRRALFVLSKIDEIVAWE